MRREQKRENEEKITKKEAKSYIYMIRCQDNSIYTGITRDVKRRMKEHKSRGKDAAKYTKTHPFLRLEAVFEAQSWSEAARLEYAIKHLTKQEKEALIKEPEKINELFGERFSDCYFRVSIVK